MLFRKNILIKTGSKIEKIENKKDLLNVWIHEKPYEGRANEALINFLARHFDVPRSSVKIIRGLKSKNKIVEIRQ